MNPRKMKIQNSVIAVAFSVSLAGVASQMQAADYAIVLKTLSNPFWVSMKGGIEKEAQKLGVTVAFQSAKNIQLVASQPADWDRLRALDVATNIMQTNPDLKAFYCS